MFHSMMKQLRQQNQNRDDIFCFFYFFLFLFSFPSLLLLKWERILLHRVIIIVVIITIDHTMILYIRRYDVKEFFDDSRGEIGSHNHETS